MMVRAQRSTSILFWSFFMNYLDDTLTDDDMLAWLSSRYDGEWTTNALGEAIVYPAHHYWRRDLIQADEQLKGLISDKPLLESKRLIRPATFGSEAVVLAPDPLLDTVTTLYTVLVEMFHNSDIGRHYRPSPHITRFLRAFGDCAYLHEAGFYQPPTLRLEQAEQVVLELNKRLMAFYTSTQQPDFTTECYQNRRNSCNNYQRVCELIGGLFGQHSRLLMLRVDLAYTEVDTPYIDYETARYHREQLCRAFHTDPLFEDLLGYFWKLEWQPQKGFHYHFLFFFDGHQRREDITLAQRIGELWAQPITGGQGLYFNCNLGADRRYQDNAMGLVDYYDFEKRRGLDHLAKYLTKIDESAAMLVRGRTFQTSKMPDRPEGWSIGRPRQFPTTWAQAHPDA
jgi:hypothetical protein